MLKQLRFFISLSLLAGISGCTLFDKEEPIPSYIRINSIGFTTNPQTQGTSSNKITDAWVYLDNDLIGAFELPAMFPVLADGEHNLKVKAGIKMNGISDLRLDYPFYTTHEQSVTLSRGAVTEVSPSVTYRTNTVFAWMENFEGTGTSIDSIQGPNIVQDASNPFEGNKCGMITLSGTNISFEIRSANGFNIPTDGRAVFLELNYLSTHDFNVGVVADGNEHRITQGIHGNLTWNKIYVNITPEINRQPVTNSYKIFFSMLKPDQSETAVFRIDNIKLIY